jgi:hypothetical protein
VDGIALCRAVTKVAGFSLFDPIANVIFRAVDALTLFGPVATIDAIAAVGVVAQSGSLSKVAALGNRSIASLDAFANQIIRYVRILGSVRALTKVASVGLFGTIANCTIAILVALRPLGTIAIVDVITKVDALTIDDITTVGAVTKVAPIATLCGIATIDLVKRLEFVANGGVACLDTFANHSIRFVSTLGSVCAFTTVGGVGRFGALTHLAIGFLLTLIRLGTIRTV